jgi:hypothetical protein
MSHVEEERRKGRTLNEWGRVTALLPTPPTRTRPLLALPPLPTDAVARAETLEGIAVLIVQEYGPVTGLALSAAIDEATEVEGCAGERA